MQKWSRLCGEVQLGEDGERCQEETGCQRPREEAHAGAEHSLRPPEKGGAAVGAGQETVQVRDPADGSELHHGSDQDPGRS